MRAYARRRTDFATADDVVGEVFAIAWRRFDEVPARSLPWLLGCARRVLANQRRGEERLAALRGRLRDMRAEASWVSVADGELAAALQALSERDRDVLMLIAWEGLDPAEAALVLGCSRGAASVRLHRARRRLESALARVEPRAEERDTEEVLP